MRRGTHERFRVYTEDEFFAGLTRDEPSQPVAKPHAFSQAHRALGGIALVGAAGTVCGLLAVSILSSSSQSRRKAVASRDAARTRSARLRARPIAIARVYRPAREASAGRPRGSTPDERRSAARTIKRERYDAQRGFASSATSVHDRRRAPSVVEVREVKGSQVDQGQAEAPPPPHTVEFGFER